MGRLSLVARGAWWRRGFSTAVFAVGIVTMGVAAVGPLYARAARESTLHDTLVAAPALQSGLHYLYTTDVSLKGSVAAAVRKVEAPGGARGFGTAVAGAIARDKVVSGDPDHENQQTTVLAWRDGFCAHVVVVSGRCPSGPDEVMVSQRTIDSGYGWSVGRPLQIGTPPPAGSDLGAAPSMISPTIVGSYRPRDTNDPYWFGEPYFAAEPANKGLDKVDAVFTTPQVLESVPSPDVADVVADYPVAPAHLHLTDVAGVTAQVKALEKAYAPGRVAYGNSPVQLFTSITTVLASTAHAYSLVNVGTLLVTLQLSVLAWLVLFQVMADAVEARGSEVALAKLRGLRPFATLRFGLAEPLLLLVLALPVGLLAAYVSVHLLAGALLSSGIPVVLTWSTVAAVLAGFTGGCAAALLAARRTLTRPILEQWRRTGTPPGNRWAAVFVDLAVAVVAVVALVRLRDHAETAGQSSSLGLLSPGLLVLAVGLLGVRLLPLAGRALVPVTRASARVGAFLAVRQVARRPAALRLAALLAVAVGLATFALAGEGIASANRTQRARAELGAQRVLSVQTAPGHDPVAATRLADPAGAWAMAAATWLPDGGGSVTGTVLGVDSSRLRAVAYSVPGLPSAADLQRTLSADTLPLITIAGSAVRVTIDTTAVSMPDPPQVEVDLRTSDQPFLQARAGALALGTHQYTVAVPCAKRTCLLNSLTWWRQSDAFTTDTGTVTVTSIEVQDAAGTWQPVNARLTTPSAWRPADLHGDYAKDTVSIDAKGVHDQFAAYEGASSSIQYADAPREVAAVATPSGVSSGASVDELGRPVPLTMTDFIGASQTYRVVQRVPVLPGVLDSGLIIDINPLLAHLPEFEGEAAWSVWLGPSAPSDAVARLEKAGLLVQGERTVAQRVKVLGRQGPALALELLLVCAIAGAVLAVGAVAVAVAASGRRRAFELAALRAVGVRTASLVRSSFLEQVILLITAVVLGLPAGWLAARLSMSTIPEYADVTPVPSSFQPSLGPVGLFAAGFVVLLAVTALVAAVSLVRSAVPARLREAES